MAKRPAWKQWIIDEKRITGQASMLSLINLQKNLGLSAYDIGRIVRGEPNTRKGLSKEQREKEKAAKEYIDFRFGKASSFSDYMPKEYKGTELADIYKTLSGKEQSTGKVTIDDLINLKKNLGLTDQDLERIARGDLKTDSRFPKEQRDNEVAAKNYIDSLRSKSLSDFEDVSEKYKNHGLSNLYNLIAGKSSGSTVSQEQAQAAQELQEAQRGTQGFDVVNPGQSQQAQQSSMMPTGTGDIITQQSQQLINELASRIPSYGQEAEIEIPKGATKDERRKIITQNKEIKKRNAEVQRRGEILSQGFQQLTPQVINAIQQGEEPIAQFGNPNAPGMLGTYDRFVNLVRPERTAGQRFLSGASRLATPTGTTIGQVAGNIVGGPLGGALGGLAGSLLGAAGQYGLNKLAQPKSEFYNIGTGLAGEAPGYFSAGTRGLAGLISGEQPVSKLGALFGGASQPAGRIGRLRGALGSGVRTAGRFLQQPGSASQLRNILSAGKAIYDLGNELGLGEKARWIAEKLGLVSRRPGLNASLGGQNMAASILPSAYAWMVPELQRQSRGYLGYSPPAQALLSGIDEEMLAALTPQIVEQELTGSKIRSKAQSLAAQQRAQQAAAPIQQAAETLQQQQQQQRFARKAQMGGLRGAGETERAKLAAQRRNIAIDEIQSGQPLRIYPGLQPVPAYGSTPEVLEAVGSGLSAIGQPLLQEQVRRSFTPTAQDIKLSKK